MSDPPVLDTFDITKVDTKQFMMLVFGPSGAGKTFFVKDLVYQLYLQNYWKEFYLMSKTENTTHAFNIFPKKNVSNTLRLDWIEAVINKRLGQRQDTLTPLMIVIDDFQTDRDLGRSKAMKTLFTLGRNLNLGCIILLQNINPASSVGPEIRTNANFIVLLKLKGKKNNLFVQDEYLYSSNPLTRDVGKQILEKYTTGFIDTSTGNYIPRLLVISLKKWTHATFFREYMYTYVARPVPADFVMGPYTPSPATRRRLGQKLESLGHIETCTSFYQDLVNSSTRSTQPRLVFRNFPKVLQAFYTMLSPSKRYYNIDTFINNI